MKNTCIEKLDNKLKFICSLFTRVNFEQLMTGKLPNHIEERTLEYYSSRYLSSFNSFNEYINDQYKFLLKFHRNEYVYKNSLLKKLIKEHAQKDTVIFSEFKVGSSYADLVMFNGQSRAYEIKTELDNSVRLKKQLRDYKSFFQKVYIVTSENLVCKYRDIETGVGIILLKYDKGRVKLETYREAERNDSMDVEIIMQTLHTDEYKKIIRYFYGELPPVGSFDMYDACMKMLKKIDPIKLHKQCLACIKTRPNNFGLLKDCMRQAPTFIQACLALRTDYHHYEQLISVLNQPI